MHCLRCASPHNSTDSALCTPCRQRALRWAQGLHDAFGRATLADALSIRVLRSCGCSRCRADIDAIIAKAPDKVVVDANL